MKKEIICTVCPRSCRITVEGESGAVTGVTGNACKRGEVYAAAEFTHPERLLTTSVKIQHDPDALLAVRSAKPLPKEKLFDCMSVIRAFTVSRPVAVHDVLIENICGTGVDIIASADAE